MDSLPSNFATELVAGERFILLGKERNARFYYHQTLSSIQDEEPGWEFAEQSRDVIT